MDNLICVHSNRSIMKKCTIIFSLISILILFASIYVVASSAPSSSSRIGREPPTLADLISNANQPMGRESGAQYYSNKHTLQSPYREVDLSQFDSINNNDPQIYHSAALALAEKLKQEASSNSATLNFNSDYDFDDQQQSSVGQKRSLFGRFMKLVKRAIAPGRDYYTLIQRYRKWTQDYNEFRDTIELKVGNKKYKLRTASDLMRIEYAKLDKELMEDSCSLDPNNELKQFEVEKVDFVLQILRSLIINLELIMKKLRDFNGEDFNQLIELNVIVNETDSENESESEIANNNNNNNNIDDNSEGLELRNGQQEADVEAAIARAKRIAYGAVGHVASVEALRMVKLFLFNALATSIVNRRAKMDANGVDPRNDVLSYLEPIILLLGTPNTSLIVTYLRNIQFRASLALVSHSINLIRPCARLPETYGF